MKYTDQTDLLIDYAAMVKAIREAEQSRNLEVAISAFQGIWNDIESEPDFSDFTLIQQAELFRLSGYFLTNYGKVNNRRNFQERAKNHLTKSIEIYLQFNEFKYAADAQNSLALCYFYEGAILESETILEQTAEDFLHDKLDLVYLQNRGNLLSTKVVRKKYAEALEIIEEIMVPMEFCKDKKACIVFNEKAGLIFRGIKQYNRAIYHYHKAIQFAKETDNLVFLGLDNNNLANLYRIIGNFEQAHLHEDVSIEIATTHKMTGWLPHFLDTKATIYFDEGKFEFALENIDKAISIFQKGEDAGGLTEALWNKCKFLLYLDRKQEAIKLFSNLATIASERMGEFAVDDLSNEFADLIHIKQNGSLEVETKRFRRLEIVSAIRKAKYELNLAADYLKVSLDELMSILDSEFPELYEEINIEKFVKIKPTATQKNSLHRRNISELSLPNLVSNIEGQYSTFYFSPEIMGDVFGYSEDVVMAIVPTEQIMVDNLILIHNKANGIYSFGKANYDKTLDIYFLIENDEPKPFSLEEVDLIGKAFGYFPFSEIDKDIVDLRPL